MYKFWKYSFFHVKLLTDSRKESTTESEVPAPLTSLAARPVVYPPVIRLMLLTSDHAPVGTVFIITSEESSKGLAVIGSSSAMCPTIHFPGDPAVQPVCSFCLQWFSVFQ